MPIKISDNLPAAKILESENVFVMTENRYLFLLLNFYVDLILFYSASQDRDSQSHAQQGRNRDTAAPSARKFTFAGGYRFDANSHAHLTEHDKRTSFGILSNIRSAANPSVRRDDHHRCSGGKSRFPRSGLLGRTVHDYGLVPYPCLFDSAHLLGGAGGAVPSSRDSKASSSHQNVGDIPAPPLRPEPSPPPGI